jgi:hypothetical protein
MTATTRPWSAGPVEIRLAFEPRDLWLGVYWNRWGMANYVHTDVYLCLLPMLPIVVTVTRKVGP